jgi:hypothetical protein
MTAKLYSRRFAIERLEGRCLMAGDVSLNIFAGNLVVAGDQLDNAIAISSGPLVGDIVVRGLNDGNGTPTRINGIDNAVITLHGVTNSLLVKLDAGNDAIALASTNIAGDLLISGGAGNDTVTIGAAPFGSAGWSLSAAAAGVAVAGNAWLDLGPGGNRLAGQEFSVGKNLVVLSSAGSDHVNLDTLTAGGSVLLTTGGGDDEIALSKTTADSLTLDTAEGADSVALAAVNLRLLTVALGPGDDTLHVISVDVADTAAVFGGPGDDTYLDGGGPLPGITAPRLVRRGFEHIIGLD